MGTDLNSWVDEFTGDLIAWALHKVSDEEQARDLVQDTFLAAAVKLDSFRGESSPKTFLFSISNHKIIDHYRKKVRKPFNLDDQQISTYFNQDGGWIESRKPQEWQVE